MMTPSQEYNLNRTPCSKKGRVKQLSRFQRAECRALSKSGVSLGVLARERYKCSEHVILHAIKNKYSRPDNLDSDNEYLDKDRIELDSGHHTSSLVSALNTAYQNPAGRPKDRSARKSPRATEYFDESSKFFLNFVRENASAIFNTSDQDVLPSSKGISRKDLLPTSEGSSPSSQRRHGVTEMGTPLLGIPTPLTVLRPYKRKPIDEGGMSVLCLPANKITRTEGPLDKMHPQPSDLSDAMREDLEQGHSIITVPSTKAEIPLAAVQEMPTQLDVPARGLGNDSHVHDEQTGVQISCALATASGDVTTTTPFCSQPDVLPASTYDTDSLTMIPASPSTAPDSPSPPPPLSSPISSPVIPNDHTAIASFLGSLRRDLSMYLPTFVELGIRNGEDLAMLRDMPRRENKKWFDELVAQGKFTPFDVHVLLCALHG